MKKENTINKERLQRFGLVAGSLALGLVIGIYATFQFMIGTNQANLTEIVETTVKEMERSNSGASAEEDASASLNDKGYLEEVRFEKDKGGGLR